MIAAGEIMAGGMRTLLVGAGERIRKLRRCGTLRPCLETQLMKASRALLSNMQPTVALQYQPMQMKNAKIFILDTMYDPDNHVSHARRYALQTCVIFNVY